MTISNPPIDEAVWSMTDEEYAIWLEFSPHTADDGHLAPQLKTSDNNAGCIITQRPIPMRIKANPNANMV